MKFVKKYEELDKVALFIKLQFIEEHGFRFIGDSLDRELRNCIAHLRFKVEDEGNVEITPSGKLTQEELLKKFRKLIGISRVVMIVFSGYLDSFKTRT